MEMAQGIVEASCRTCCCICISQCRIGAPGVACGTDSHITRIGRGVGRLSGNPREPGFPGMRRVDAAAVAGGIVHTGWSGAIIKRSAMAGLTG